jgi:hypothetical protein
MNKPACLKKKHLDFIDRSGILNRFGAGLLLQSMFKNELTLAQAQSIIEYVKELKELTDGTINT